MHQARRRNALATAPKAAVMNVHFSSKTDDWATPQDLFDKLNNHFNFTLDVCASDDN